MSGAGMGLDGIQPSGSPLNCLTDRERQVADYITTGRSNKFIAFELGLSQRTVEAHRARIFIKVGVRNAVELTHRCVRWHLNLPVTDEHGPVRVPGSRRAPTGQRHRQLRGGVSVRRALPCRLG